MKENLKRRLVPIRLVIGLQREIEKSEFSFWQQIRRGNDFQRSALEHGVFSNIDSTHRMGCFLNLLIISFIYSKFFHLSSKKSRFPPFKSLSVF